MRSAVEPHGFENRDQTASHGSLHPFESEPLKKKIHTQKNKRKRNTTLLGVHHVFKNSATAISRETQHVFMFLLLLSSEHITQLPLLGTLVLGEASFKF